jgi:hypothetical protein
LPPYAIVESAPPWVWRSGAACCRNERSWDRHAGIFPLSHRAEQQQPVSGVPHYMARRGGLAIGQAM